jgi:cysteine desulfurase
MSELLYFDHAASAPRREEVAEAMAPYMHGVVGNPSGTHRAARAARRAVEEAREEVAAFAGIEPGGVIFTAGGTESCQLAIQGVALHHHRHHDRTVIATSPIEHHAVLGAAEALARDHDTIEVVYVPVDENGLVNYSELPAYLDDDVAIVSVMTVNNETGVVQPIGGVSTMSNGSVPGGVVTHTDAVAAAPWLDLSVVTQTIDLISICGHKLGGPVNSGALLRRSDVAMDAAVPGGEQERGLRGGTVDVAAAVGLAAAVRATARDRIDANDRVNLLRERLENALRFLPGAQITAAGGDARRRALSRDLRRAR